jgi:hypothetical protein
MMHSSSPIRDHHQHSSNYETPTETSTIKTYFSRKIFAQVAPILKSSKKNKDYSFASSTYTLHDAIITTPEKVKSKKERKRDAGRTRNRENSWQRDNNIHITSSTTSQSSPQEVLHHSDYPTDLMINVLALERLQLLVSVGYSYSSLESEHNHAEHYTNVFIAQDIFNFFSSEIYKYYPCLNVQFMRHNLNKPHWKRHQFISNYSTTFDIQIALKDHNNKFYLELLYFGSKYKLAKSFLSHQIKCFFDIPAIQKHLLDPTLLQHQHQYKRTCGNSTHTTSRKHDRDTDSYGDYDDENNDNNSINSIIPFPEVHHSTLRRQIRGLFGPSDEVCSHQLTIFDARSHSFHPIFRNGMQVCVMHACNRWGGQELFPQCGYVLGCYTHDTTQESILYIQHEHDHTASFLISTSTAHCYKADGDRTHLLANEAACPDIFIPSDKNILPFPLELLVTVVKKDMRVASSCCPWHVAADGLEKSAVCKQQSKYCRHQASQRHIHVEIPDISTATATATATCSSVINEGALHLLRENGSSARGGDVSQSEWMKLLRAEVFHCLHALVWRTIELHGAHLSAELQLAYSEDILSWILLVCGDHAGERGMEGGVSYARASGCGGDDCDDDGDDDDDDDGGGDDDDDNDNDDDDDGDVWEEEEEEGDDDVEEGTGWAKGLARSRSGSRGREAAYKHAKRILCALFRMHHASSNREE